MGKSTAASLLGQRGVTIVDTDLLARQLVEPGQPALSEIQLAFGAEMLAPDGVLRRDLLARRVFSDSTARKTLEDILHPRIRKLWQSQLAEWRASICGSPDETAIETAGETTSPKSSRPLDERAGERPESSPSPPPEERAGERRPSDPNAALDPPLPKGEGWGEGEHTVHQPIVYDPAARLLPPTIRANATAKEHFFCIVIPLLFETHAESELDATICLACSPATQHRRLLSRGWSAEQIAQRIKSQLSIEEKIARADYVIWNDGPTEILAAQLDRVLRSVAMRS